MNTKVLGLFSGFPARQFPDDIAARLKEELPVRESLVFVSAWPAEYERNDADAAGMHGMFVSREMAFQHVHVIDDRMEPYQAKQLIREAACIFLMGGNATKQLQLMRDKGIVEEIRQSKAVILGVSAGSSNMAKRALDIWESPVPYNGLGLTDITIKAHVTLDNQELLRTLMAVSAAHELPICAMEDESAIFIKSDEIACTGRIRWICNGIIAPFLPEMLNK